VVGNALGDWLGDALGGGLGTEEPANFWID
jgi:hypothetical protein